MHPTGWTSGHSPDAPAPVTESKLADEKHEGVSTVSSRTTIESLPRVIKADDDVLAGREQLKPWGSTSMEENSYTHAQVAPIRNESAKVDVIVALKKTPPV